VRHGAVDGRRQAGVVLVVFLVFFERKIEQIRHVCRAAPAAVI
jgi:hypothetical protein